MKGKVIKIENGIASIELERTSACKGCGLCLAGKDPKTMVLLVKALPETKVGDFATVQINREMKVKAQLWLLAAPLFVFIVTAFFSYYVFKFSDSISFILSVLALALTYCYVWFMNKKKRWDRTKAAKIVFS